MKLMGIETQPMEKHSITAVALVVLTGFLMIMLVQLLLPVTIPVQSIFGMMFAITSGAVLSMVGIRADKGIHHTIVVIVIGTVSGFSGALLGAGISNLVS